MERRALYNSCLPAYIYTAYNSIATVVHKHIMLLLLSFFVVGWERVHHKATGPSSAWSISRARGRTLPRKLFSVQQVWMTCTTDANHIAADQVRTRWLTHSHAQVARGSMMMMTMIIIIIICRRCVTYVSILTTCVLCTCTRGRLLHGSLRLASKAVAKKMCDNARVTTIKCNLDRRAIAVVWRGLILLLSRHYHYHYVIIYNKLSSSYYSQ